MPATIDENPAEEFLNDHVVLVKVLEAKIFSWPLTVDFGQKEIESMLSVSAYSGRSGRHASQFFLIHLSYLT